MTVLGKSPCYIAKDANVTCKTAVCGMIPGLLINGALWWWAIKNLKKAFQPGYDEHPLAGYKWQTAHEINSCEEAFKYLAAAVLLTMTTSLVAFFYRIMGAKKICNGKCSCLISWVDTFLTLGVFVAVVNGLSQVFEAEDLHECKKLQNVSLVFYASFSVISFFMLIPGLFVICCVGTSAHAREASEDQDDVYYQKLIADDA
eukprot:gb/GFBE01010798.1/.p1 GENE.gb/GFBE01010798.1/~~gb/GFBE01010798.1/.p1  ORF type:complete len:202 (+),score=53.57 gb/GFBE01010798.1/:1-606(+)